MQKTLGDLLVAMAAFAMASVPSTGSAQAHRQHRSASAAVEEAVSGAFLVRRTFPSSLPRYLIQVEGTKASPQPPDLGELGPCRGFGAHIDGDCIDYFVGDRVVPLKSKRALEVSGKKEVEAWHLDTQDGRSLRALHNPAVPETLDDGARLERYVLETRLEKQYRSPGKAYLVAGLQSNPSVPNGGEQVWGLRKFAPTGEVLWDYVYLVREPGAYVASTGEIVGTNPVLGLNEAIFPAHASFALLASTANLYQFPPKAKVLDPESLEAATRYAYEIDLSTGKPASNSVVAVDYERMRKAYAEQLDVMFNAGAFSGNDIEQGAAHEELVRVLDNSEFHDRVAKVIEQFFQSGSK